MARYHFNKETGRAGKCEAKIQCRLGLAESEHFSTKEEAQLAYEKTMNSQTVQKTLQKHKRKHMMLILMSLTLMRLDLKN